MGCPPCQSKPNPAPATSQLNTCVRALAISQGILGSDHPEVAVWRNNLGGVLQAHGDLAGAQVQYERALSIGEAALGPDHLAVATYRGTWRAFAGSPGAVARGTIVLSLVLSLNTGESKRALRH